MFEGGPVAWRADLPVTLGLTRRGHLGRCQAGDEGDAEPRQWDRLSPDSRRAS